MALPPLNAQQALIFRIVHRSNLDGVLRDGCRCRADAAEGYVEIGNQELIQRRVARAVPCVPGGTLSDYVPFHFTPCTPMLYNIKTGWGVPQQPLSSIVILVSSLRTMAKLGIPFVFTDRHAYLKTAQFSGDLADLNWIIWPTLQARDFRRDDADKFEKYQAEALIHRHVPVTALLGIVCYDDSARGAVEQAANDNGVTNLRIEARAGWYP